VSDAEFLDARTAMMQTVSGKNISILTPFGNTFDPRDIAHHLSHLCRFTGAVRWFYSVAEHCVLVARLTASFGRMAQLQALLHDASEAYLNDLISPLKHLPEMAPYRAIEARFELALASWFGLPAGMNPIVKSADNLAVRVEKHQLKGHGGPVMAGGQVLRVPGPWRPERARFEWLRMYADLTGHHHYCTTGDRLRAAVGIYRRAA
jgi:uncharacterized protein